MAKEACRHGAASASTAETPTSGPVDGGRLLLPGVSKGAGYRWAICHFSQGDGEIAFCGAIEMDAATRIGFDLIKGGMAEVRADRADLHAQPGAPALRAVP